MAALNVAPAKIWFQVALEMDLGGSVAAGFVEGGEERTFARLSMRIGEGGEFSIKRGRALLGGGQPKCVSAEPRRAPSVCAAGSGNDGRGEGGRLRPRD